jgi:MscS family membrane protein
MIIHDILKDSYLLEPNWKWLALLLIYLMGKPIKKLARVFLNRLKLQLKNSSSGFVQGFSYSKIDEPSSNLFKVLFWYFALVELDFIFLSKYILIGLKVYITFTCIHMVYIAIEVLGERFKNYVGKTESTLDDQLAPFFTKALKVIAVSCGILFGLQGLGFNVVSLLAGLGLGGLALALAAQDTAANLFGSITILLDRPFQIGDFVRITDTEGTVEEVGFRSTRIRTPYNSLVTLPNSLVAKEKIDNFTLRPTRQLKHNLGFTYSSKLESLNAFCEHVRYYIAQSNHISAENSVVELDSFGESSINVLVQFNVKASTLIDEKICNADFIKFVMDASQKVGLEFAFPTRTLTWDNQALRGWAQVGQGQSDTRNTI